MIRHVLYWAFFAAMATHGANGYTSMKIISKTGGFAINDTSESTLGGASHYCYRNCTANETLTCYYEFYITEYSSMGTECGDCPYTLSDCFNLGCISADGNARDVTVVNHMLPGPSIQVCKGDIVQVKVFNALPGAGVTVHWHGMWQLDSPYMDGVPMVTQCPIQPGNSFVYNFTAEPSGTHIWHSHVGLQETNGMHGGLIVREADDPLSCYYDYDLPAHIMLIYHWYGIPTGDVLVPLSFRGEAVEPYSLTVNGYANKTSWEKDGDSYYTPRANFTVTKGFRYRFRVIENAAIYCPVQFSVDNHTLLVIATDGAPIEPITVDSIMINAGERYDCILTADQDIESYWMRFRGLGECGSLSTVAVLIYEGANSTVPSGTTEYDDANRSGVLLNPMAVSATNYSENTLITIADLNSNSTTAKNISGTPDYTFYVSSDMTRYGKLYAPGPYAQFNNMSHVDPPMPLLTQYKEITDEMYCTPDNDTAKECWEDYCTCPYLYEAASGSLVEFVFVDESVNKSMNHPQHLHGQRVAVVALVYGNTSDVNGSITLDKVKARNEAGLIEKKLDNAPLKDTIGIPDRGYAVLRVVTDNPGYWFFHCHVSAHLEEGMAFIFKVGNDSEMIHPPSGFPTCSGSYNILTAST